MEDSPKIYIMEGTNVITNPVPKKKHSMVLNLENKTFGVFGADQTPTPTRFIRNCEEVGLFQDLQNVNPFEETFRKAVESGKTGSTALQNCRLPTQVLADDTLHTPHVFPHIIENDSIYKPDLSLKIKTGNELLHGVQPKATNVDIVRQEADTSQRYQLIAPHPVPPRPAVEPGNPVQLILEMPDGRLMQLNATPLQKIPVSNESEGQGAHSKLNMTSVILHTSPKKKTKCDISPIIKEKLKAHLGAPRVGAQPSKQGKSGDEKLAETEDQTRNKRKGSTSDDDEDTKRKKFLERNRAAAMRCREKRKCWVSALEQRAEQLMTNNHQLQMELMALRTEVAQLKILLLAHKDCSVTRAMSSNSSGSAPEDLSSMIVRPDVSILEQVSVNDTEVQQVQENLPEDLQTTTIKKYVFHNTSEENIEDEGADTNTMSLDLETEKSSQETSPIVGTDEYLSSAYLTNDSLELESFKSVATQVIQFNPNLLNRQSSFTNIEGPLLPISPNRDPMDYS